MNFLIQDQGFSERTACRLLKLARSSYRYKARNTNQNIIERLKELAKKYPRFGSPRLGALLRREGTVINHKKVARLCRLAGLTLKLKRKKRIKIQRICIPPVIAERPMQVWGIDFVHHRFISGEKFRCFTIVDHNSKECPGILVMKKIGSEDVIKFLDGIKLTRGLPQNLNLDNGTEFTSHSFVSWCADNRISLRFIRPGKPVENAFIESFNGKFRNECLSLAGFKDHQHAAAEIERWRNYYNHERPHSALNYRTPVEAAVPQQAVDHA